MNAFSERALVDAVQCRLHGLDRGDLLAADGGGQLHGGHVGDV